VLAFFARRATDPEQTPDVTAEAFAAELVARRRSRPVVDAPIRAEPRRRLVPNGEAC
jgi:hypothetical protein